MDVKNISHIATYMIYHLAYTFDFLLFFFSFLFHDYANCRDRHASYLFSPFTLFEMLTINIISREKLIYRFTPVFSTLMLTSSLSFTKTI